jgi:hypothetical protein
MLVPVEDVCQYQVSPAGGEFDRVTVFTRHWLTESVPVGVGGGERIVATTADRAPLSQLFAVL